MNNPGQLPVIAIFSIVVILGSVFVLDRVGIIATPLSLENGVDVIQGTNTSERDLFFAQSWIETKLISNDAISSSRTNSVVNTFTPFSLSPVSDPLKPITRAELFIYTDYSKMGSNIEFDFPRSTIKQFVTVNGIPVDNVPKQLLLENTYNENTKLLKGAGIAITPDFFEQIVVQNSKPLQSGDIIEVIMTVEARYDSQLLDDSGNVIRMYDGWIKGLNTSIAFVYHDPDELLQLLASGTNEIETNIHLSGCVDANFNGICDTNDSTVVQVTTVDSNNDSTSTTTETSTLPQTQTTGNAGDVILEEPVVDEDTGSLTSIFSSADNVIGSSGVNVNVEELESDLPGTTEQTSLAILNTIKDNKESGGNTTIILTVFGILIAIIIGFILIKRMRNK